MDLSKDEQYLLGLVIKTSASIDSEATFRHTLYPIVCELFPHKMFFCELGLPSDHSRHHMFNISFPQEYLPTDLFTEGVSKNRLSRLWLQDYKPQYLDQNRLSELTRSDEPWLSAFEQRIFKNMACYGIYNDSTRYVSIFYFGDITRAWNEESRFLLKLFIPHLHAALVNVYKSSSHETLNKDSRPEGREPSNLNLVYST